MTNAEPVDLPSQVRRAMRAVETPPQVWPPGRGLADHRLVFLAAKPAMDVLSRSRWGAFVHFLERSSRPATNGGFARGVSTGRRMSDEGRSEQMRALVVACDELRSQLTPAELQALRERGELPGWFVPELHSAAKAIKRQMR